MLTKENKTILVLCLIIGKAYINAIYGVLFGFLPGFSTHPFWKEIGIWIYGTIIVFEFTLLYLIIRLNKDNLHELRIDNLYIVIFLVSGILNLRYFPLALFTAITLLQGLHFIFFKKNNFDITLSIKWKIILSASLFFASLILIKFDTLDILREHLYWNTFIFEVIPFSVFEEAVYRGVLIYLLINRGISESKSFIIASLVFWLQHVSYISFAPFFLWIELPIMTIILGYVSLRTKSIGLSSIAHIFINIILNIPQLF